MTTSECAWGAGEGQRARSGLQVWDHAGLGNSVLAPASVPTRPHVATALLTLIV